MAYSLTTVAGLNRAVNEEKFFGKTRGAVGSPRVVFGSHKVSLSSPHHLRNLAISLLFLSGVGAVSDLLKVSDFKAGSYYQRDRITEAW